MRFWSKSDFCLCPPCGSLPLSASERALLTGWWVDAGRKLRLAGPATDLDRLVEIDFQDSERTIPKQVVGGKSGQSAEGHESNPFGCGVFLGHWRPDSKLKPEQRIRVAVKVMQKFKRDGRSGELLNGDSALPP